MASQPSHVPWLVSLSLICILFISQSGASTDNRKTYVVYMGDRLKDSFSTSSLHISMLQQVIGRNASKHLLYSYQRSFNGFSAKLTEEEAQKLAEMDGVVSVFPSGKKQKHTTRSWDFLGFSRHVKRSVNESNIIVGVIDTGIWPESESFSDEGFSPPPKKWKGICQTSPNFTCNNKIIGARYYHKGRKFNPEDLPSPRDSDGHGTHTASTAAGNVVSEASLMGLGLGTARGGVPSTCIAVYKTLWSDGSDDADLMAAFDDAIADGVDIISISIGGNFAKDYFSDSVSIGAFHAMKHGILTSHSAGNEGPHSETIESVSPWFLSVAASTIDRKFITPVQLGNKMVYAGLSINTFELSRFYPIIYAGDAPNTHAGFNGFVSSLCTNNSLDKTLVKGKIVLCNASTTGEPELLAGAVGSVTPLGGFPDVAFSSPLPASSVDPSQGRNIYDYIKSTRDPTAIIKKSTEGKDELAPYVATFSSRGPNPIARNILKPDLTAPGVDILAAWSPIAPVSEAPKDVRYVRYNIDSGTSMACPHATAVAAYIKSFHPTWSPAAIKSALMTTATPMRVEINKDAEFAYGAGQINPLKAVDPGLVYDASEVDYVKFLCAQGYSAKHLKIVTGDNSACSEFGKGTIWDLNYPSFALPTLRLKPTIHTFYRTVTNVGSPVSTYKAKVDVPSGVQIGVQVEPSILQFKYVGQKLSFKVAIISLTGQLDNPIISASLVWADGAHQVRSPIVVYVPF